MTNFLRQTAILVSALVGMTIMSSSAIADSPSLKINEPSDETLQCIHPEDEMRRNHMKYILHERDETMHEGVRGEAGSLAACIDCHVEPAENGEIPSIESKDHFCNGCHQYAAVQIDCFQCHADRPQKFIDRSGHGSSEHSSSIKQQLMQTLAAHNDINSSHSSEGQPSVGVNQ